MLSTSKQSRQIARPAVERSWSRDYINKILYTNTHTHTHTNAGASIIIGTYHPIAERRNPLHASMVFIIYNIIICILYIVSNDQTAGVEKRSLIIHGRCNEGAHAYNTSKKEKSLCAHNTSLLQSLCVCEMVL